MAELYRYFVEGECEAALLKALMHSQNSGCCIRPGKIEVINILYQTISPAKVMTLKKGTKVVFVFDTDVNKIEILKKNINTIFAYSSLGIKDILFVQSCLTFEDELVYSCKLIKDINDLLGTTNVDDFKKKFINHKDIVSKLVSNGFDINKIWSRTPKNPFSNYEQGFKKIIKN